MSTAGWRGAVAAFLSGAVLTSAQAPVSFWPALFIGLPALFLLLCGAQTARRAAWIGWFAGTGYFAFGLYWVAEAFLVDIARHGWMAPFAITFLAGGLALFWMGAAYAAARLGLTGFRGAIAFAGSFTAAEMLRTYILSGFPWNLIAYGWLETPLAQVSALIGPHGIGFLTLLSAALLGHAAQHRRAAPGVLSVVIPLAGLLPGLPAISEDAAPRADALRVRVVQPNAQQTEKWTAEGMAASYRRALSATAEDGGADITVWPETAVPLYAETPAVTYGGPLYAWADIAAASGERPVIVGTRRAEGERGTADRRLYNSLALVGSAGRIAATYDKHHLVPFGEYLPFNATMARLGLSGLAVNGPGFASGPGPRLVEAPGVPRFLPLICYEAIFPHQMDPPGGRPEWIVHITNDAWFGASAGPYQHLAQARFRAIEQGLPVVRAANTGISAVIGPRGRVLASVDLGKAGQATAVLPAALDRPLYSRSGDLPLIAFLVLSLGALAAGGRRG